MIVSYGRSYVFVHIPKSGGTSLSLALEQRAKRDDLLIGDTPKAKRRKRRLEGLKTHGRLWKHSTLADIDGLLSEAELQRMFVFTMVRNPWDWYVSLWAYGVSGRGAVRARSLAGIDVDSTAGNRDLAAADLTGCTRYGEDEAGVDGHR